MTKIGATSLRIDQDVMKGGVKVIFDRAGKRYVRECTKYESSLDNLRVIGLQIDFLYGNYILGTHFFFIRFFGFAFFFGGTLINFFIKSLNLSKESGLFVFGFLDEFGIGQSLSRNHCQHGLKSHAVIVATIIKSECLFVKVSKKMRRIATYISATKGTLEQRPVIFYAVCVDIITNVFGSVVNAFMDVFIESIVGLERVCKDIRASVNTVFNFSVQGLSLGVSDNLNFDFARRVFSVSLQNSKHDSFANSATSLYAALQSVPLVHILGFASDVCFIGFDFAAQFFKRARLHGCADAMQYKPCSLLGNSKSAMYLKRANAIFSIGNHPNRREPLIQANWRPLEDSANLYRKFFFAIFASPNFAGGGVCVL